MCVFDQNEHLRYVTRRHILLQQAAFRKTHSYECKRRKMLQVAHHGGEGRHGTEYSADRDP